MDRVQLWNRGRVSQSTDNIGRTVNYTYDANGLLQTVTDPEQHVTSYTWDTANGRLLTIKPPSLQGTSDVLVTNEYTTAADAPTPAGWVKRQTHVDGGVYQFAYTFQNGQITQTVVTDPRGKQRRVSFNTDGYTIADDRAVGETEEQEDTSERPSRNNFVTSSTNPHGDVTATEYDALGRVTRVTRLPGTADEAVTTYTYDPVWTSEIATVTDPLGLVAWHCGVHLGTVGTFPTGAGIKATCTSECLAGRQLTQTLSGAATGASIGYLPASYSYSEFTLHDNFAQPTTFSLPGLWMYSGAGLAGGVLGGAYSSLTLGGASSGPWTLDWEAGFDAGLDAFSGVTIPLSSQWSACKCK